MKKVSLFLMTFKGLKTLESIIDNDLDNMVKFVVIGKDKNTLNDYSDEIETICKTNNIEYYFRNETIPEPSDYIITISWRWLIKNTCSKIIVLHESLLPKYRGFAPLVNQLINGENKIGVTAIFGEKDYDTGEIIRQASINIAYPITIREAIEKVSELYDKLIVSILADIKKNNRITNSRSQDEKEATYSLWRDEEDYKIDWSEASEYIQRFINAVGFPYKGAYCNVNGEKVRINKVDIIPDCEIEIRDPGKVLFNQQNKPVVVCGSGLLRIEEAIFDYNQQSIFPLRKFRNRFK